MKTGIQPNYFCIITLSAETDEKEFERFLVSEVFPHLEVLQRNVQGTTHFLFKSQEEQTPRQYIWMMHLDLVGTGTAVGGVEKVLETLKTDLQSYGTLSPPFAQVTSPGK